MSTILLGGVGPRPSHKAKKVYATGLRLQTLAEAILQRGHNVHLIEADFAGVEEVGTEKPSERFKVTKLSGDLKKDIAKIKRLIKKYKESNKPFDAIVTSTDYVGHVAAMAVEDTPLWCDFFGHPMAERQMQAYVGKNNTSIEDQWRMILPILLKADQYSVCSNAQRLALIGELGAVGRLGYENCLQDLVQILAPPNPFTEPFAKLKENFIRGKVTPEDARIILFTGGYNTWLDEETLFNGVEEALGRDEKLHYVSTGGEIVGHVTDVFQNFKKRVDSSKYKGRFHFLGWISHDEFVQCCLESDVGVMIDQPTLEGELGCRNRLYSWIWAGMRIVTSDLSEPTREQLVPHGWVTSVPMKDSGALAKNLLDESAKGRLSDAEMITRNEIVEKHLAISTCFKSLADWCEDPKRSEDNALPVSDWNSLRRNQWNQLSTELNTKYEEIFDRLQGSRLFGLYKNIHPDIRKLFESVNKIKQKK